MARTIASAERFQSHAEYLRHRPDASPSSHNIVALKLDSACDISPRPVGIFSRYRRGRWLSHGDKRVDMTGFCGGAPKRRLFARRQSVTYLLAFCHSTSNVSLHCAIPCGVAPPRRTIFSYSACAIERQPTNPDSTPNARRNRIGARMRRHSIYRTVLGNFTVRTRCCGRARGGRACVPGVAYMRACIWRRVRGKSFYRQRCRGMSSRRLAKAGGSGCISLATAESGKRRACRPALR